MHIRLPQEDLSPALSVVNRSVATRTPLPALSAILFQAQGDQLTLSATDLETTIALSLPCTVLEEGELLLPARYVVDLIRKAPSGPVDIQTLASGPAAEVIFGRSRYTVQGFPPGQFPRFTEARPQRVQRVPTALLQRAVRDVAPAVATKDTRPILMGIQLRLGPHHFQALATDGFRVAHVRFPLEELEESLEVVAPARGLQELTRLLEEREEEEVEIAFYDQRLAVELPGLRFHTALLNGSFPDVLSMVPTQYPTSLTVSAGELVMALQRSLIIAAAEKDRSQVVTLKVSPSGLEISAKAADVGSSTEEVAGEGQGPELQLAFNAQFLLEGLRPFPDEEEVRLLFAGPRQALLITGTDESPYRYYVLPVLLSA